MDVREKLVELLSRFYGCDPMYYGVDALAIAQHLIANGVTVQVCKLEDKKTNADHIRSMTDEELALWICGVYDIEEENGKFINGIIIPGYAPHDIEEWLQQPVEEG